MKTLERLKEIEKFINDKSLENQLNEDSSGILEFIGIDANYPYSGIFRYNQFDGWSSHDIDCSDLNIAFKVHGSIASYRNRSRKVLNTKNHFKSEGWGRSGNAYVNILIEVI